MCWSFLASTNAYLSLTKKSEKMKNYIRTYFMFAALLVPVFTACDDSSEISPLEKELSLPVLSAYETVSSGPKELIQTAEANVNVAIGDYSFNLAGVSTDSGEDISAVSDLFGIDTETGVISISSTNGKSASELAFGRYSFSVGVSHIGGVEVFENIAAIDIVDLPFTIAYNTNQFELAFGQLGEFATVAVSSDNENLEVLSYELTAAPEGIEINGTTGALSKTSKNVPAGVHQLSLKVQTNEGVKNFTDLVELTVGDRPQLYYTNNGVQFTNVAISSWSGFSTAIGGKTEDLGTGLSYSLKDTDIQGLSIDANSGEITLAEDSNLNEGNYTVNITVVDEAGFEVNYNELFTISVANSWEQIAMDDIDVSAYADKEARPVNDQYAYFETSKLNASAVEFISYKHASDGGTGFVAYGWSFNLGKNLEIDAPLLREVDMDGTYRKMKVSFGETSVGKIQSDNVLRRFYFGYTKTELIDNSNFVDAEWNLLIDENSDKWAVNNYKTDFKQIETEFVIDDPAQDKLYLQWRVTSTTPATGFTRACFNAVKIEVVKKTAPVFEE